MAEEEEKLLKSRMKEEEIEKAAEAQLDESQFNKLDQLSTQTQLCAEFLLEKIGQITANGAEQESEAAEQKERGRVSKRRAAAEHNSVSFYPLALLHTGVSVVDVFKGRVSCN
ncbi:ATP-DEPENDENT DNA HELICASE DDM1-LIKE ISOFORM X1 [Salix purpurea]|uniref:ATP-DEPENDENT DNA HELICASE DDM1-LIKE ISOFORM X1 n=1 Tax=Salix purpurea TaxID=77065 RepID=A0A9Q0VB53_SALPP|nr:ATP-DEPENDENT DNA HELICASE DDM1-LIKE ISOFORM X1 [Salix purpurea]